MTVARTRSLGAVLTAAACVTALSVTPAFQSGVRALITEVSLVAGENLGWIMGGTGNPIPDSDYLSNVEGLYLGQYATYNFEGLATPEQFCPIICSASQPDLSFGDSVNAGVGELRDVVVHALQDSDNVSILGYSQSATVATVFMNDLINNTPAGVDLHNLHVTLLGDPNNAVSGILDRFQFPDGVGQFSFDPEPQHIPFLGIPMGLDPTPVSGIDTDIFIGEYDGWNNFPSDPLNLFAVGNALIGIETVHPYYPDPDPGVNLDTTNMIDLGTVGSTNFWAIPAPLPTLAFMYDGGPAGHFFYDSFSPFATLVNNWGYGNPGDPDAGIGIPGADPIGVAGPWQVDAYGQLVLSSGAGFIDKMDPLQMLAGVEYAAAQTIIGPTNDILAALGQPELPDSVVSSLLSLYDLTNQLDVSLLTSWADLAASFPSLAPDVILDGSPLISAQPLIDLVGYGFDVFNFFGA
jgi:hypothetical protein